LGKLQLLRSEAAHCLLFYFTFSFPLLFKFLKVIYPALLFYFIVYMYAAASKMVPLGMNKIHLIPYLYLSFTQHYGLALRSKGGEGALHQILGPPIKNTLSWGRGGRGVIMCHYKGTL